MHNKCEDSFFVKIQFSSRRTYKTLLASLKHPVHKAHLRGGKAHTVWLSLMIRMQKFPIIAAQTNKANCLIKKKNR